MTQEQAKALLKYLARMPLGMCFQPGELIEMAHLVSVLTDIAMQPDQHQGHSPNFGVLTARAAG